MTFAEDNEPFSGEEHSTESSEALTIHELADLCRELRSDEEEHRRTAVIQIVSSGPSSVQTIRRRLRRDLRAAPQEIQELLNRLSPDVLGNGFPRHSDQAPFDILPSLISASRAGESTRRTADDTLEVVTLLRALVEVRTSAASRIIVAYGARELGVFKAEIARNMVRLDEIAIPALLRSTQHPNENVAQFATDLLEWLRRTTPGRQVQVRDSNILAEILSVYGEIADRSTVPVLLSFSGSEIAAVRTAARDSLLRYGSSILWPARTKYENFTGEEPNRNWDWQELARRLFEAQDAARMVQAERTMAAGLQLAASRDYEGMFSHYQQILSRWPHYERRDEMIDGLVAYANQLERQADVVKARELLTQALFITGGSGPSANELRARLAIDDVERNLRRGVAYHAPLDQIEIDSHSTARVESIRTHIASRTTIPSPYSYRLVAVVGLFILALGCFGFFWLRG